MADAGTRGPLPVDLLAVARDRNQLQAGHARMLLDEIKTQFFANVSPERSAFDVGERDADSVQRNLVDFEDRPARSAPPPKCHGCPGREPAHPHSGYG